MKRTNSPAKKRAFRRNFSLVITSLIAVGLLVVALYVHYSHTSNKTTLSPNAATPNSAKSNSHPGAGSGSVTGSSASPAPAPSPSSGQVASTPSTDPQYNSSTLAVPTQYLNKSTISLSSNSPSDSPQMDSTCNSVANATCAIHATMGQTTIVVVPPTSVDPTSYAVEAQWNAKDLGLTPGVWVISAVASLNGQTSTSTSNTSLTVNP
ncbi:MAG: hypothetical protein ACHQUB_03210 [Candidatus Saccharimonadia bacterium]